jgi:hypothetical protein
MERAGCRALVCGGLPDPPVNAMLVLAIFI